MTNGKVRRDLWKHWTGNLVGSQGLNSGIFLTHLQFGKHWRKMPAPLA